MSQENVESKDFATSERWRPARRRPKPSKPPGCGS